VLMPVRPRFISAFLAALASTIRTVNTGGMSPQQINDALSRTSRYRGVGKPQPAGSKLSRKAAKRSVGLRSGMTFADRYKPSSLNLH
jgi:hypothetical protein